MSTFIEDSFGTCVSKLLRSSYTVSPDPYLAPVATLTRRTSGPRCRPLFSQRLPGVRETLRDHRAATPALRTRSRKGSHLCRRSLGPSCHLLVGTSCRGGDGVCAPMFVLGPCAIGGHTRMPLPKQPGTRGPDPDPTGMGEQRLFWNAAHDVTALREYRCDQQIEASSRRLGKASSR